MSWLIAAFLLLPQDDLARWIEQLGHDSIEQRDIAMRRLHGSGLQALGRLEKAARESQDVELRARLMHVIGAIRKSEELRKVFGPTRRVTMPGTEQRLKDVLNQLLKESNLEFTRSGNVELKKRITLDLKNATWWEAMDRTARAAGIRYDIEARGSHAPHGVHPGPHDFIVQPGAEPAFPVSYLEQFRVSVVESKRLEYFAFGRTIQAGHVVVEVRPQPDLKPTRRFGPKPVRVTSVRDAKGAVILLKDLPIGGGLSGGPRGLAFQADAWIPADAALPLTVEGEADLLFDIGARDVALDRSGTGSGTELDGAAIRIARCEVTPKGVQLTVRAEAVIAGSPVSQLVEHTVYVEDGNGKKHRAWPGHERTGGGSKLSEGSISQVGTALNWEWCYEVPGLVDEAKKVHFKWAESYRVQFPFRLEGVTLP